MKAKIDHWTCLLLLWAVSVVGCGGAPPETPEPLGGYYAGFVTRDHPTVSCGDVAGRQTRVLVSDSRPDVFGFAFDFNGPWKDLDGVGAFDASRASDGYFARHVTRGEEFLHFTGTIADGKIADFYWSANIAGCYETWTAPVLWREADQ